MQNTRIKFSQWRRMNESLVIFLNSADELYKDADDMDGKVGRGQCTRK